MSQFDVLHGVMRFPEDHPLNLGDPVEMLNALLGGQSGDDGGWATRSGRQVRLAYSACTVDEPVRNLYTGKDADRGI